MPSKIRDIAQQYWRHQNLPHVELRSTHQSVQGYKAHSHAALSIGLIESGRTKLHAWGKDHILEQGDLVLIEPELVHACNPVNGHPRSYHMLYIDAPWCLNMLSALYAAPVENLICEQKIIRQPKLFTSYLALVHGLKDAPFSKTEPMLNRFLLHILSTYCSPSPENSQEGKTASYIKQLLLDQLAQPPSLHELSKAVGYSKETIIRLFKKTYGITPKAFIHNARVENAKLLLKEGMRIVDTAIEVGYSDQSQFHRSFVNYTASTPRQYCINFQQ